jgi:hypothetical protein
VVDRESAVSESSERPIHIPGAPSAQQGRAGLVDIGVALERLVPWQHAAERVAELVDLDATAAVSGVTTRRRGMPCTQQMLTLALLHGPGGVALRELATYAQIIGFNRMSEASLLRMMLHAAPWLDHIAEQVMIEQLLAREAGQPVQNKRDVVVRLRPYQVWQHIARTAQQFIEDLLPWPTHCFNEDQSLWLMAARWNYVAATLRCSEDGKADTAEATPSMQRVRRIGQLIAALLPEA